MSTQRSRFARKRADKHVERHLKPAQAACQPQFRITKGDEERAVKKHGRRCARKGHSSCEKDSLLFLTVIPNDHGSVFPVSLSCAEEWVKRQDRVITSYQNAIGAFGPDRGSKKTKGGAEIDWNNPPKCLAQALEREFEDFIGKGAEKQFGLPKIEPKRNELLLEKEDIEIAVPCIIDALEGKEGKSSFFARDMDVATAIVGEVASLLDKTDLRYEVKLMPVGKAVGVEFAIISSQELEPIAQLAKLVLRVSKSSVPFGTETLSGTTESEITDLFGSLPISKGLVLITKPVESGSISVTISKKVAPALEAADGASSSPG